MDLHPLALTGILWAGTAIWIFFIILTNRKSHPKALFYLFFVEMWERFSYYGMRGLLTLYMIASMQEGGFGLAQSEAYGIYAAYGAMVYLTPILGGFLAEYVTGYRKAIIWGAVLMTAGHVAMAVENQTVFIVALGLLILGNGFFKPNISSLIGKLYPEGDPRRDSGFTIFYMGINVGAFLTGFTCGTIGQEYGWHYGFGLAGIGMAIGLVMFLIAQAQGVLENQGFQTREAKERKVGGLPAEGLVYIGSFLLLPALYFLIIRNDFVDYMLMVAGGGLVAFMIFHSFSYGKVLRERMWVIVVLLFFTTMFWAFFELAGSALNVFTENNVNKEIPLGFMTLTLKASNFQSFNPLFIILFAPLFSFMWDILGRYNMEPAAPVKFGFGLVLLGAGFLVLQLGTSSVVEGMMPAMFIILLYLLHTLGELALSPVGLSLVTKLSPPRIVGFMMGFWFLSSSIAHQVGKPIAQLTAVPKTAGPEESLEAALEVFTILGWIAIGAGVFLWLLSPLLIKWMHKEAIGHLPPEAEEPPIDHAPAPSFAAQEADPTGIKADEKGIQRDG